MRHKAGGQNMRKHNSVCLMSRSAISGLVCTTFLMFLGFSAVPQESERKGADTESGQLTFNNACRTCHTTKEGDNRLGPSLHNIIGRKAGSLPTFGYSSAMKGADFVWEDRKSTRLNSSHLGISYAVFCLKKKIKR